MTLLLHAGDGNAWQEKYQPENDDWKGVKQHFIFNSGAEPESLDPHKVTTVDGSRLMETLFDGLVSADPETLEPRPACAETWTVSDDLKTYTFTLRKGLKWSNGDSITASDFARSFERALTPSTQASYAALYTYIVGADAFRKDTKIGFKTVGIKVLDPLHVQIHLRVPCPYFLELLTLPVFFPVPLDLMAAGDAWSQGKNHVSNGAFVLESWQHRSKLVLKKNPSYWDSDFVKLEKITALCIDDMNTAYKLFQEGKVHWLPGVPQSRIEEIKRNPDFYSYPYFGTYFYRFNVTRKPFDDPRVRRAFSLATNRGNITEMLKGGQRPVASYCPPVAGFQPANGLSYDVQAAQKLLAEAGYPKAQGLEPIEIVYNTNEGHKQVAEAIAQQWRNNLGVNVVTRNMEWKVFLSDMKALNYTIARSSWIGDYSDPSTFYECFSGKSGNNRTGWVNPTYDALLAGTRTEQDTGKRMALFAKLEKILVEEECPIMPIYRYVDQGMLSESVLGWYSNIRSVHPLKFVWLEQ
jgi:oligopeptide transport system substrate-binding protein